MNRKCMHCISLINTKQFTKIVEKSLFEKYNTFKVNILYIKSNNPATVINQQLLLTF